MLRTDIIKRSRMIQLKARRVVATQFSGAYNSVFKGRGMTFLAVRPYEYGDDVRAIDWKVTARTGDVHIKEFVEDRELTVLLVIDASASVLFGTESKQKRDLGAEIGAILAYCAIANRDNVGLLLFTEQIEKYIPPKKNRNHVLNLISTLLSFEPQGRGTDMKGVLEQANRVLPKGSVVIVISDFVTQDDSYTQGLRGLTHRHEVLALELIDPIEEAMPDVGMMAMRDLETDDVAWVDTSSIEWREEYRKKQRDAQQKRQATIMGCGAEYLQIPLNDDYISVLTRYFQQRARRNR